MKKYALYISFISVIICSIIMIKNSISFTNGREKQKAVFGDIKPDGIQILIDVNEKKLYVFSEGSQIAAYPIATGRPEAPSPLGDFMIIQKSRWGEGFGAAWMRLSVPWGIYGIHGTNKPQSIGHAASSGCIRMRNEDVNELYKIASIGTRVKITGGLYGLLGNGYRMLSPGDRGSDVYLIQDRLKKLGFYTGNLDGIYGISMERALYKFEESRKIPLSNRINERIYKELGLILFE